MDNYSMPLPPHIEKILKLLVLSGKGNPNAHEREVAKEKAEALMKRHEVTRDQMRDFYRQDHGLPLKPPRVDPVERERLQREAVAREAWAQAEAARVRMARAQAERERAAQEREERERVKTRLRAAMDQALASHKDFSDFIDCLAGFGIEMVVSGEYAVEQMVFRWPPHKIAIRSRDLGDGYDWPSLLAAGIAFDLKNPRHRESLAMIYVG